MRARLASKHRKPRGRGGSAPVASGEPAAQAAKAHACLALAGCALLHWPLDLRRQESRIRQHAQELESLGSSLEEADKACAAAPAEPPGAARKRDALRADYSNLEGRLRSERQRVYQTKGLAVYRCLRYLEKALPHPLAMHNLAILLESRDKTVSDFSQYSARNPMSVKLELELELELEAASSDGHVSLCGTAEGRRKALELFAEAAGSGVRAAQYVLAMRGLAHPTRRDECVGRLRDVAESASRLAPMAQYNLGMLLGMLDGADRGRSALRLLERAAAAAHAMAQHNVGAFHEAGFGTPPRPEEAARCYGRCGDGSALTALRLGLAHLDGSLEPWVARDEGAARRLLARAAALGSRRAALKLAHASMGGAAGPSGRAWLAAASEMPERKWRRPVRADSTLAQDPSHFSLAPAQQRAGRGAVDVERVASLLYVNRRRIRALLEGRGGTGQPGVGGVEAAAAELAAVLESQELRPAFTRRESEFAQRRYREYAQQQAPGWAGSVRSLLLDGVRLAGEGALEGVFGAQTAQGARFRCLCDELLAGILEQYLHPRYAYAAFARQGPGFAVRCTIAVAGAPAATAGALAEALEAAVAGIANTGTLRYAGRAALERSIRVGGLPPHHLVLDDGALLARAQEPEPPAGAGGLVAWQGRTLRRLAAGDSLLSPFELADMHPLTPPASGLVATPLYLTHADQRAMLAAAAGRPAPAVCVVRAVSADSGTGPAESADRLAQALKDDLAWPAAHLHCGGDVIVVEDGAGAGGRVRHGLGRHLSDEQRAWVQAELRRLHARACAGAGVGDLPAGAWARGRLAHSQATLRPVRAEHVHVLAQTRTAGDGPGAAGAEYLLSVDAGGPEHAAAIGERLLGASESGLLGELWADVTRRGGGAGAAGATLRVTRVRAVDKAAADAAGDCPLLGPSGLRRMLAALRVGGVCAGEACAAGGGAEHRSDRCLACSLETSELIHEFIPSFIH